METSKWRYGCGKPVTVYYERGWETRSIERPCGSTGPTGHVVQCDKCADKIRPPLPPDYGDI